MERWFEFMANHPFLFGLMGVLIIMFFSIENKRSGKKIAPTNLGVFVNENNAQVIDIRPKNKFDKGHIAGSRNIPFTDLKDKLSEIRAIQAPVILVCDIGMQAGAAVAMIAKEDTYRLEGGISGWQSANLPLVNSK